METERVKLIQEIFRISVMQSKDGKMVLPIIRVRENIDKFSIIENELKEYLCKFTHPSDCKMYIPTVLQKIYRPSEEDYLKDEALRYFFV